MALDIFQSVMTQPVLTNTIVSITSTAGWAAQIAPTASDVNKSPSTRPLWLYGGTIGSIVVGATAVSILAAVLAWVCWNKRKMNGGIRESRELSKLAVDGRAMQEKGAASIHEKGSSTVYE